MLFLYWSHGARTDCGEFQQIPSTSIKSTSAAFSAAALLLSIPSILVTTPALPIPISIRRSTNFPLSKVLIYIITICLAILPAHITRFGSDVILILAFLSTFVVPGTSMVFFKLVLFTDRAATIRQRSFT